MIYKIWKSILWNGNAYAFLGPISIKGKKVSKDMKTKMLKIAFKKHEKKGNKDER